MEVKDVVNNMKTVKIDEYVNERSNGIYSTTLNT